MTNDEILHAIEECLVEVAGDELLLAGPITPATSFNADLELESIEFVALSERLQEHYGERVDFVAWLSDMELPQIIGLTVGELVDHITESLS
jgi:acyl carrier protein